MKKLAILLSIGIMINSVQTVHAESLYELYKRDPEAYYKKILCIDEESIENGYYSDINPNNYKESSTNTNEQNKGYVFGNDELHVTGTPSDQSGYTKAGDYTGQAQEGKGYVYGCDELHVVGLPSDPETGYTLPGYYGEISE